MLLMICRSFRFFNFSGALGLLFLLSANIFPIGFFIYYKQLPWGRLEIFSVVLVFNTHTLDAKYESVQIPLKVLFYNFCYFCSLCKRDHYYYAIVLLFYCPKDVKNGRIINVEKSYNILSLLEVV